MKYWEDTRKILCELHKQAPLWRMKSLRQHGTTSTYQHCLNVAYASVWLASLLPIRVDLESLVQGAMLHDFYLYDWHDHDPEHRWHGFYHPKRALCQSLRYVALSERSQNIILAHMWPLTLRSIPLYREAWLVCLADKGCALVESAHFTRGLEENTRSMVYPAR